MHGGKEGMSLRKPLHSPLARPCGRYYIYYVRALIYVQHPNNMRERVGGLSSRQGPSSVLKIKRRGVYLLLDGSRSRVFFR